MNRRFNPPFLTENGFINPSLARLGVDVGGGRRGAGGGGSEALGEAFFIAVHIHSKNISPPLMGTRLAHDVPPAPLSCAKPLSHNRKRAALLAPIRQTRHLDRARLNVQGRAAVKTRCVLRPAPAGRAAAAATQKRQPKCSNEDAGLRG
jgi:hypothetical protein